MIIDILRPPATSVCSIEIDDASTFNKSLMYDWFIQIETTSKTVLPVQIGDYIVWDGDKYYLNKLPEIEKINNKSFKYTFIFQSMVNELSTKLYLDGVNADFSLNGTADDFINLLITNINSTHPTWTKGVVDTTEYKTLQFVNEYCSEVLVKIAEEFSLEFNIDNREITLTKDIGTETAIKFEYGRGKGLYNLTRQQVSNQNILTRVYGFGGDKNLLHSYRGGANRLIFDNLGVPYLEKNVDLYGIIEGQFTDNDIFPQRTGTLTEANIIYDDNGDFNANLSYVEDSSIDFDLNDQIAIAQSKIVFKSADMEGVECEIFKYDHTNRRIYFNAYEDAGYVLPRENGGFPLEPKIGDTYTLIDIAMPQSYIDTQEALLKIKTQEFLDENCTPMVVYDCEIDPKYAKTLSKIDVGYKVKIIDNDLGINEKIRIAGIEYPLVNPFKITATIADFVPYTVQDRIIKETITNKQQSKYINRRQYELARRNRIRQEQLKDLVFDTDGYFDGTKLKPNSIETLYLAVGAKSSEFRLNGVVIEPNYEGNLNAINISSGQLVHLAMEIESLGYIWEMSSLFDETLETSKSYYIYAKCSKTVLTGEWVVSETQITANEDVSYYHFLTGILYVPYDGARDYDFINGMTYMNGRIITTGRIRSLDGLNYFDLDENKFRIGDSTSSLDWNVSHPNTLVITGGLVQRDTGDAYPIMRFMGAYNPLTIYYQGDQVTYNGSSWNYINTTPKAGQTPVQGIYWAAAAIKGNDGTIGSDGTSAITILLTNEAFVCPVVDGVVKYTGSNTSIRVWEGLNPLSVDDAANPANGTFSIISVSNVGIGSRSYSTSGVPPVWANFGNVNSLTLDTASTTFTIKVKRANGTEEIFTRVQSISRGAQGGDGKDGENAISIVMLNEAKVCPVVNGVPDLSNTGTSIGVFEGTERLTAVSSTATLTAGKFQVQSAYGDGNITVGSQNLSGTPAQWVNFSNVTSFTANSATITFIIKVMTSMGIEMRFSKTQSFAKALQGSDGKDGVPLNHEGDFDPSRIYHKVDYISVVKKDDLFYKFIGTDKTFGAWNSANWEMLVNFKSVATEILVADTAAIQDLTVKRVSTAPPTEARVDINVGNTQEIVTYDSGLKAKVIITPNSVSTVAENEALVSSESKYPTATSNPNVFKTWNHINGWGNDRQNHYSSSFVTNLDGTLEIEISNIATYVSVGSMDDADGMAIVTIYLQKYIGSIYQDVALLGSTVSISPNRIVSAMIKGTYRLRAEYYQQGFPTGGTDPFDPDYNQYASVDTEVSWGYITGSSFDITIRKVKAQTEIGSNGINSVWATNKYLNFTDTGLFIKVGTKTLEITTDGVKINGVIQ